MVTENNYQINSFSTGMDSDSSISNIKDSSYLEAKNIRVLSYGSNNDSNFKGSIKPINGITQLDSVISDNVERILASGSIRQYGVIIYISETNDYPEICVATFTNKIGSGNDGDIKVGQINDLKTIFRSKLINWPSNKKDWPNKISISFKYESKRNVKLYMATGYNPICVLNLAHGVYDSNIDLDTISSYPKVIFNKPKFFKYISGRLKPALVRYSYQLYNDYGVSTDISPSCQSIPVVNFGESQKDDIMQIDGQQFDKDTNCGIQIRIENNDDYSIFNRIKIYRITTQQNGQIPTIEIIYDSTFYLNESDEFIFNDVGKDPIDTISIEEYNSMSGIHIIPKAIESKDDILFAANIKQSQTLIDSDKFKNWDARSFRQNKNGGIILKSYTGVDEETYSFNDLEKISKSQNLICREAYNEYNDINKQPDIEQSCVYDEQYYYGGTGINVSWRFIISNACIDSSSANGGKEIGTLWNILNCRKIEKESNKCYFIHKDNGLIDAGLTPSNEPGRISNEWITKSLRRNELYRYGIILYDKSGYASPVKWIADIRTPNLYDKYFYTFISHYKVENECYDLAARNLGIAFKVSNLPEGCTGYEIVRCKRSFQDIATVSQGVISKPIVEYRCPATQRAQDNTYFPTGMLTTATVVQGSDFQYFTDNYDPNGGNKNDSYIVAAKVCQSNIENNNIFQFVSPEICYQPESMKTVFKNKDFKLEQLRYIFGCSAQSKSGGSFGNKFMPGGASGSGGGSFGGPIHTEDEVKDYYGPLFNVKRCFLKPSIGNTNYILEDNPEWKFVLNQSDNKIVFKNYSTQKFWLKMNVSFIRSIYYKANAQDAKWTMRSPGFYNSSTYTNSSGKMNGIDLDVFAYIKLYEQGDVLLCREFNQKHPKNDSIVLNKQINQDFNTANIKSISIATDLKWDEIIKYTFQEKGSNSQTKDNGRWWPQLEYLNHIDSVGQYQYCNAVFYGMNGIKLDKGGNIGDDPYTICFGMTNGANDPDISLKDHSNKDSLFDHIFGSLDKSKVGRIPYSTGGRCALLQLDNNLNIGFEIGAKKYFQNNGNNELISTSKRSTYNDIYINSIVGTSICNIRKTATPYGGQSVNSISSSTYYSCGQYFNTQDKWNAVFDGDVYISVLDYTSMHKSITNFTKSVDDASHRDIWDYRSPSMMLGYAIPLESTINCRLSYGFEFSKNSYNKGTSLLQVEPSDVEGLYSQVDPEYVFNTAYSSEDKVRVHSSFDYNNEDDFNKSIDNRCMYSLLKESDEHIDSWTKFQSSNYLDVDSRYGQITGLSYYDNTLVFWQQFATGILSVNDRSLVNDNNGSELILGSGGVLSRYDYLDTESGMHKEQFCYTKTKNSLYWFDDHNDEIKMLQGKTLISLGKQCNIQNLLYKYVSNNHNPILAYDIKNDEVICNVLNEKQSVSYSEIGGCFQSIYTIPFDSAIQFDNGMYLTETNNGNTYIAQWDAYNQYSTTWRNNYCNSYIKYAVNKNAITTKVFDNQEIVTPCDEYSIQGNYYFDNDKHMYQWSTETQSSKGSLEGNITQREHNYRYAIPRFGNGNMEYGNRLRGKYLLCEINNSKPNTNISIQYIITKFRESCS